MYALFEISCALKNKKINSTSGILQMSRDINESNPLSVEPIPIDQDFINKYLNPELPYMKAGDLIFVAMAKADEGILITEDNDQYNKAKSCGIKSYRIKEFLNEFIC